jgi:hypothetical protein
MLSLEECKKYLKNGTHTDNQIEEIREKFYQLAEILITEYFKKKEVENNSEVKNPEQRVVQTV